MGMPISCFLDNSMGLSETATISDCTVQVPSFASVCSSATKHIYHTNKYYRLSTAPLTSLSKHSTELIVNRSSEWASIRRWLWAIVWLQRFLNRNNYKNTKLFGDVSSDIRFWRATDFLLRIQWTSKRFAKSMLITIWTSMWLIMRFIGRISDDNNWSQPISLK